MWCAYRYEGDDMDVDVVAAAGDAGAAEWCSFC
jgi:hypothetical protein